MYNMHLSGGLKQGEKKSLGIWIPNEFLTQDFSVGNQGCKCKGMLNWCKQLTAEYIAKEKTKKTLDKIMQEFH